MQENELFSIKQNDKIEQKNSQVIDIEKIFIRIAPYLVDPNFIQDFLNKHSTKSREEIIKKIEIELKKCSPTRQTDLRILSNAL